MGKRNTAFTKHFKGLTASLNYIVRLKPVPNINTDQLQAEILRQVQTYGATVQKEIDLLAKESVKEFIKDVKKTTAFKSRTGDYNKGWKMKKTKKGYIAYNKTEYRLTHLLEKGHAKRGGGRVEAKIHIAPAEDRAIRAFLDGVERVIES